eukprot:g11457.t1
MNLGNVVCFLLLLTVVLSTEGASSPRKKVVDEEGKVDFQYCDSDIEREVSVKRLQILPVPLEIGNNGKLDLHLEATKHTSKVLHNITRTCQNYIIRLTFIKKGLTYETGFLPLCDLVNLESHEIAVLKSDILLEKQLDAGIYTCYLRIQNTTINHEELNLCLKFDQIVTRGWVDYVSAIVAFSIAAAASWQLGQWVTLVDLPLITGYLIVGVICGPYVCNLLTDYKIYLIGPQLNNLSLSFISFAAGEEIYFPALKGLFRGILFQIIGVSIFTVSFIVIAFNLMSHNLASSWTSYMNSSCYVSVSFLLGIIMVARSPATIVALLQEMDVSFIPTQKMKLIIGVTIVSDIVVLVGFGVISAAVSSVCPVAGVNGFNQTLDGESILLLLLQFVGIGAIGTVCGFVIFSILAIPFQRFSIKSMVIYRSYMKGSLIIPFGVAIFVVLDKLKTMTLEYFGKQFSIEPLLVCMVASSIAAHRSEWREQFSNILQKFAPYILLPFFTLTGASLELSQVITTLPLAVVICLTRIISIYLGSTVAALVYARCNRSSGKKGNASLLHVSRHKTIDTKFVWLTYLSQAGIALGLSLEIKDRFRATFGGSFETLVLSVVILNQVLGPPLAKYGMQLMMKEGRNQSELTRSKRTRSRSSSTRSNPTDSKTSLPQENASQGHIGNEARPISKKKFSYTMSPFKRDSASLPMSSKIVTSQRNQERTFSRDSLLSFEDDLSSLSNTPLIASPSSAYFGLKKRKSSSVLSPLQRRISKISTEVEGMDLDSQVGVDYIIDD